jgi:hypothetical protein
MPPELVVPHVVRMKRRLSGLQDLWQAQESRLFVAIVSGSAILVWQSDAFFTLRNLQSVLIGCSFIAVDNSW